MAYMANSRMNKIMFRKAERWTEGIYDGYEITTDGVIPISQHECISFLNSPDVKFYGKDNKGYMVYGK